MHAVPKWSMDSFLFAQIKMVFILTTTTVKLPAQGVQETPLIKVYRNNVPRKKEHQLNRQNKN